MKKGSMVNGTIGHVDFPNKGVMSVETTDQEGKSETQKIVVKGTLPGQKVTAVINKGRKGRYEARLLEVNEKSPLETEVPFCPHFGICGGCCYQTLSYESQLELKAGQVKKLLDTAIAPYAAKISTGEKNTDGSEDSLATQAEYEKASGDTYVWEPPTASPKRTGYRNKMEFTFGNEYKDGPLVLGLHKKGSFYDIVPVHECAIMDESMRKILTATENWARESGLGFYHKMTKNGYFRHLLIRRSEKSGELLVDLVTCSTAGRSGKPETAAGKSGKPEIVVNAEERYTGKSEKLETAIIAEEWDVMDGQKNESDGRLFAERDFPEIEITDSQMASETERAELKKLLEGFVKTLRSLSCGERIVGILHTVNDSSADAVIDQGTEVLYGKGFFTEEILGLSFKITPFSFFQTNSLGAEKLYEKAREYVRIALDDKVPECDRVAEGERAEDDLREIPDQRKNGKPAGVLYDLYSGTGTIGQLMAAAADRVYGIEIVEEAVVAANENAKLNGLSNCSFIAGDVFKKLDELEEKPDIIILDPPREGVLAKALTKILAYGVDNIVYISCKPTSLANDLALIQEAGYRVVRATCVDMFPFTANVECVTLLQRMSNTRERTITLDVEMEDYHRIKNEGR